MPVSNEFAHVLSRFIDLSQPLPPADLYHFSDLDRDDLAALEAVWAKVPAERRLALLQDLGEIGEANLEVQFEAVFRLALEDEDAEARATAVENLWESESPQLIVPFLELLRQDPDPLVRATAASALGRYVYLGEMEELPAKQARRVEDALLAVITGPDDLDVRRRALEAVAFSSRPEVAELISQAYAAPELPARVSAVFAMGRNSDERWNAPVLAELESLQPELVFEAARAAGELELAEAVDALQKMVEDGDLQVREAAIWSLGQIGGDAARAILLDLLQDAADSERDFLEDALENLHFHDEMVEFDLLTGAADDETEAELLEDALDDDLPPPHKRLN